MTAPRTTSLVHHRAPASTSAICSIPPQPQRPMPRTTHRSIALFVVVLLVGSTAHAQRSAGRAPSPTLVVNALNTTAVAQSTGSARATVLPNDVLRYTLTLTNPTSRALSNVELRNPMPAGVRYVTGSAHASRADARLEFSADGGKSWAAEPVETAVVAGQTVTRPIPVERYTHIRWVVVGTVAPNAMVRADFEARVGGA